MKQFVVLGLALALTLTLFGCTLTKQVNQTVSTWEGNAENCKIHGEEAFMKVCNTEIMRAKANNIEPVIPYGDCETALTHVDTNFTPNPRDSFAGGECKITYPNIIVDSDKLAQALHGEGS
jgi:hypothetical protein